MAKNKHFAYLGKKVRVAIETDKTWLEREKMSGMLLTVYTPNFLKISFVSKNTGTQISGSAFTEKTTLQSPEPKLISLILRPQRQRLAVKKPN